MIGRGLFRIPARAALILLLSAAPACSAGAVPPDDDTVEMVKAFLKMPTAELPAAHIPRFLAVDPRILPAKLRQPFLAKRLELRTLAHLAEGKKRGVVRMPAADCSVPDETEGETMWVMRMAGYEEISLNEEIFLEKETRCTQRDLMCEFSLRVVVEKKGKPPKSRPHFFLNTRDPLFGLVGKYRSGSKGETHFFGLGVPTCAPRLNQ